MAFYLHKSFQEEIVLLSLVTLIFGVQPVKL